MNKIDWNLLLADDDAVDCIFLKEAFEDLPVLASLTTVNDGFELMLFYYGIQAPSRLSFS